MQDGAGTNFETATDKEGKFKFTSTAQKPIRPGTMSFIVEKDKWQQYKRAFTSVAGQPLVNLRFAMTPEQTSATPSAPAVSEPAGGQSAFESIDPGGNYERIENGGSNGLSMMLIIIGAVLVLLGIGAIVLLLWRRKSDEEGEEEDGPPGGPLRRGPPGRGRPRPAYPARRRGTPPPDRTAVMRDPRAMRPPVSPGPGPRSADQTVIARSPLADAPTQLYSRVPADYADPTRQNPARPGYGPSTYGAPQPSSPAGPGHGQPGYGQPGHGQPSHGQPSHGQPSHGQSGYGSQGYGPAYGQQQSYGAPHGQQPDPYGQQSDPYSPGYGQPAYPGGLGSEAYPGGLGGAPDPRAPRPGYGQGGDSRRVDWLDD